MTLGTHVTTGKPGVWIGTSECCDAQSSVATRNGHVLVSVVTVPLLTRERVVITVLVLRDKIRPVSKARGAAVQVGRRNEIKAPSRCTRRALCHGDLEEEWPRHTKVDVERSATNVHVLETGHGGLLDRRLLDRNGHGTSRVGAVARLRVPGCRASVCTLAVPKAVHSGWTNDILSCAEPDKTARDHGSKNRV